jgi:protein O-GlcNAc transferase
MGNTLWHQNKLEEAVAAYAHAIRINPAYVDAYLNMGNTLRDQGQFEEAIAAYQTAISLKPDYAEAYYNMGLTLQKRGDLDAAVAAYERALGFKPDYTDVYALMGNALKEQGKFDAAIAAYQSAISLKPDYAEAYYNMGVTLQEQGSLNEAIAAYERVLSLKPDYAEAYNNMGMALDNQGKLNDAIVAYERALDEKPDSPEIYVNMGNTLKEQGKTDEAIAAYRHAVLLKPDYADAYYNMGLALQEQGNLNEAVVFYERALSLKPDHAKAYDNIGIALQEQGKLDEAIACYQKALDIKPDYAAAQTQMLHLLQHICDFERTTALRDLSATLGIDTVAVSPFAALSWADNSEQQLARSKNWAREQYKKAPLQLPARPQSRPVRLKIGYFSADFYDHPVLTLISGLLREHNKHRFEIFAFSYGKNKDDDLRQQLIKDVENFVDVSDCSDSKIADLARSNDLDIAIDLTGYTGHSRSRLFQFRLAPIQINYLGFPGSMGADFFDYIVADPVIRAFPSPFQPSASARSKTWQRPRRHPSGSSFTSARTAPSTNG